MSRFATRMSRLTPSPTLQVMNRAAELQAQGIDVIDLGAGEPDFDTPEAVCSAAKEAIDQGHTRYTDTPGVIELRAEIAHSYNRRYGVDLQPVNVVAGCGGKQELFNLMLALVDDGDEVIIPAPYWVSFPQQVSLAGGRPVFVDLDRENGFRPTASVIEGAVTDRTKVVILNSPSNPTGAVIETDALEGIVRLCQDRGLVLVSDETYDHFIYDGHTHASAASWMEEFPETVIVVNSMSKTYAMTGWRIGYAIGDVELMRRISSIQSHSTSNPSSISQFAAIAALRSGDESVREMMRAYSERRSWLIPQISSIPGFSCDPPGGAFYVFPQVSDLYGREGITDSSTLAEFLLDRARVAVVPGIAFGNDEHVRISYATSMEKLHESLNRMRTALEEIW
jgi:aspartate aminotransferase